IPRELRSTPRRRCRTGSGASAGRWIPRATASSCGSLRRERERRRRAGDRRLGAGARGGGPGGGGGVLRGRSRALGGGAMAGPRCDLGHGRRAHANRAVEAAGGACRRPRRRACALRDAHRRARLRRGRRAAPLTGRAGGGDRLRRGGPGRIRDRPGWQRGRAVDLGCRRTRALKHPENRPMLEGMSRHRTWVALLTATAAILLTLPSAARAATVAVEGNILRIAAPPGEQNELTITGATAPLDPAAPAFSVSDLGAPLTPGPGCSVSDSGVTCVTGSGPAIDVIASDLDDSVTVAVPVSAHIDGGDGDDRLTGGDSVTAEVLDFLDTACERVDYGPAGAVGRLRSRTGGGRRVPIPGQTWALVDRRILPAVLWMVRRYRVRITEGFATVGHTRFGEHPLGLAVDIEPGPGGTWADVARLARWAEPRQNRPRLPFRWVGWNGDANHGHPSICTPRRGCAPHLHLSWSHTPTRPGRIARTVWVFDVRSAGR